MPKKTKSKITAPKPEWLDPLEQSIKHWTRLATNKRGLGEEHYSSDCALCVKYHVPGQVGGLFYENVCHGCPVSEKTGQTLCGGTPWMEAHRAAVNAFRGEDYSNPKFLKAAKRMLKFLINLRPKS
jgi:hypothetical protein